MGVSQCAGFGGHAGAASALCSRDMPSVAKSITSPTNLEMFYTLTQNHSQIHGNPKVW